MFRHFILIVLVFGLTHAWDLEIQRLWDGTLLESKDFVQLCINQTVENDAVEIHIKAPFYNDPAPDAEPGKNLKLKIFQCQCQQSILTMIMKRTINI